jgi:hypothetical protein
VSDFSRLQSNWRRYAAPIIERVLAEHAGRPEPELRQALRDAYPFGPKENHPYKIWLDEINVQLGKKPRRVVTARGGMKVQIEPDPRQESMFAADSVDPK